MKKIFTLALLFISVAAHAQFEKFNMIQMGRWDNDSLRSQGTQTYNNCWGWYDSITGKEYAILGSIDSSYFFDITDPSMPILCDVEAGASFKSTWRNYKTYKNYCYASADFGFASLQIFDLSYLPDSVHKVYDSTDLFVKAHTLWIDKDRLYANSVTTIMGETHATDVFSLADPEKPVFLGTLNPPVFGGNPAFVRCHDSYVRNDTLYCSAENAGVYIYDVADMQNTQLLGVISDYPEKGYNHSGFLSEDGKTFVFADENLGLGLKAFDVSDMQDLELASVFRSHEGAIAHNPYFLGDRVYVSYYHDGLYIFDMKDPGKPKIIAWYDTYPQNGTSYSGFEGCWGVYPFLPSKNIIASDMTNGLFILRMDKTASVGDMDAPQDFLMYPNPSSGPLHLEFDLPEKEELRLEIMDMSGKVIYRKQLNTTAGRNSFDIDLSVGLSKSVYLVQLTGAKTHICKKLVFAD